MKLRSLTLFISWNIPLMLSSDEVFQFAILAIASESKVNFLQRLNMWSVKVTWSSFQFERSNLVKLPVGTKDPISTGTPPEWNMWLKSWTLRTSQFSRPLISFNGAEVMSVLVFANIQPIFSTLPVFQSERSRLERSMFWNKPLISVTWLVLKSLASMLESFLWLLR